MPQILELPQEIILNIAEKVWNTDLDNFTSTCRTIHDIACGILSEHQKRKEKYKYITYGDPARTCNEATWVHPTLMLRDLLRYDLLSYPIMIQLSDYHYDAVGWDDGRASDSSDDDAGDRPFSSSEVHQALKSFSEDVAPLVEACPYLKDKDDDDMSSIKTGIISRGSIGATLGFLLLLLPNLQVVHTTDYGMSSRGMGDVKAIMDKLITAIRGTENSKPPGYPLSKLRKLNLERSDRGVHGDLWDLDFFAPFFFLPSMRFIKGHCISSCGESWKYPGLASNIERLSFPEGEISAESLTTYLRPIKNLRKFQCTNEYHIPIDSHEVVSLLLQTAAHSLTSLNLSGKATDYGFLSAPFQGRYFIGSLQGFKVLKQVKLIAPMFFERMEPDDEVYRLRPRDTLPGRPCRFVDLLPPSIQDISLEVGDANLDQLLALLEGLPPDGKQDKLPELETISFDSSERLKQKLDENVLHFFKTHNVVAHIGDDAPWTTTIIFGEMEGEGDEDEEGEQLEHQ